MSEIDDAIGKVENLYRTLTGNDAPEVTTPFAPIPAERDPLQHVQEQMDRLNQLLTAKTASATQSQPSAAAPSPAWTPALSVWTTQRDVVFCVDLPGVTRDALDVSVHGTVVIVTGRRAPVVADAEARHTEHPLGVFRRVIALPPGLRAEELSASLREGVLSIRVPRSTTDTATKRSVTVS